MFRFSLKNFVIRLIVLAACGALLLIFLIYQEAKDKVTLINPSATVLLEDRYGNFLSEGSGRGSETIGYWRLPGQLPRRIEAVFLRIEDRRFYQHHGVDLRAVLRALWNNLMNDRRQGASTIAMQVARMQNGEGGGGRRSYWNKLCESVTALLLIRKFGHRTVLRHYLEIVPQGNRIHGTAYAARRYFRKPLQDVSWAEAAVLAALPKAPGRMNLFSTEGRKRAFTRARIILTHLHKDETLNDENFLVAQRQLRTLTIPLKETRPTHSYHAILRLEEILRQRMARHPISSFEKLPSTSVSTPFSMTKVRTGFSKEELARPIRTSLDIRIQEKVYEIARAAIQYYRASGAGNIAAMVIEKETGDVLSYLGSDDYHNIRYAGAINYARVPRSSGSTLKPFIYALGLESGQFTPASRLSDAPMFVSLPGGFHRIGNYDGRNFGSLLYRKALANSRNVPAIHVLMKVGLENTYELLRQLGLTPGDRTADYYGVGLAIGTLYVTLEDLVSAYGVIANEGQAFRLHWFGDESPEAPEEQWMSKDAARQISLFLSDPLARLPVFSRMGELEYSFPAAVKTGTSQGFRDAWAIAYSSKYLVGVWIGHPAHTRMNDISGLAAAQVVKKIMLFLHPEQRRGIGENIFPAPEGYTLVRLCAPTGRPVTDSCPEVIPEYFRPGTEPVIRLSQKEISSPPLKSNAVELSVRGIQNPMMIGVRGGGGGSPLSFISTPFSYEQLLNAGISIQEPRDGGTFVIDPDTPRTMQTLTLYANVRPAVSKIVWHVDGKPFTAAPYPYVVRWPLTEGTHTIQAQFAHANVVSDVITITVY